MKQLSIAALALLLTCPSAQSQTEEEYPLLKPRSELRLFLLNNLPKIVKDEFEKNRDPKLSDWDNVSRPDTIFEILGPDSRAQRFVRRDYGDLPKLIFKNSEKECRHYIQKMGKKIIQIIDQSLTEATYRSWIPEPKQSEEDKYKTSASYILDQVTEIFRLNENAKACLEGKDQTNNPQ